MTLVFRTASFAGHAVAVTASAFSTGFPQGSYRQNHSSGQRGCHNNISQYGRHGHHLLSVPDQREAAATELSL